MTCFRAELLILFITIGPFLCVGEDRSSFNTRPDLIEQTLIELLLDLQVRRKQQV